MWNNDYRKCSTVLVVHALPLLRIHTMSNHLMDSEPISSAIVILNPVRPCIIMFGTITNEGPRGQIMDGSDCNCPNPEIYHPLQFHPQSTTYTPPQG